MTDSRGVEPVKALLFDFDGTLLDGAGDREAIERTCREIALLQDDLEADLLLAANSEAWRHYWPTVKRSWTLGGIDGAAVRHEAWRRTLSACGYDDEALVRRATDMHSHHRLACIRAYPDALATLSSLGGYSLALVTNGASDTQRTSLRLLGIEDDFDAVVISAEVGVAKPDPRIFEIALRELGIGAENACHIGDDPRTDIAGAHAAGLTAVWLNRSGNSSEDASDSDHEIPSLAALPGLLHSLGGQSPAPPTPTR